MKKQDIIEVIIDRLKAAGMDPFDGQPNVIVEQSNTQNDYSRAMLACRLLKDFVVYDAAQRVWYVYDGRRWNRDSDGTGLAGAVYMVPQALRADAFSTRAADLAEAWEDAVQAWSGERRLAAVCRMLKSMLKLPAGVKFDAKPDLLNLENGTLNLSTGNLQPHDPADYITQLCPVVWDDGCYSVIDRAQVDALKGYWIGMQSYSAADDGSLMRFKQQMFGYSLSGAKCYKKFFILYGPSTNNGKSTECRIVRNALGSDYAGEIQSDKLAQNRGRAAGHSESIANLRGMRFLSVTEPEAGQIIDASLVKTMTGGNEITASRKGEHETSFTMTATPIFDANYRPRTTDVTLFKSERVLVVPYTRSIPKERMIRGIADKFDTPCGRLAILEWLYDGYRDLVDNGGFVVPECVKEATAEYAGDSDKIGSFLSDCLAYVGDGKPRAVPPIYERYIAWCKESGYSPESRQVWKTMMVAHDISFTPREKNVRPLRGSWETVIDTWGREVRSAGWVWEEDGTKGNPTSCIFGWRLKTAADIAKESAEADGADHTDEPEVISPEDLDASQYVSLFA